MKLLVLLAIVAALIWLMRPRAAGGAARPPRKAQPARLAQPMVRCAHCGVHLPRSEAVVGEQASFCSEAHRLAHGEPH